MAIDGWLGRLFRQTHRDTAPGAAPIATPPPAQAAAAPQPAAAPIPTVQPGALPIRKNPWEEVERALVWTIPAILLSTLGLTFALVTQWVHGVERADEKTLIVGAGALFVCVALVFLTRLIRSLEDGQLLGVESHWGGLGGGVGGWRISMPVAYFIGVTAFAALAAVAVSNYSNTRPEPLAKPTATDTNAPAAAKGTKSTSGATTTTTVTPPLATTGTASTATQSTTAATSTTNTR